MAELGMNVKIKVLGRIDWLAGPDILIENSGILSFRAEWVIKYPGPLKLSRSLLRSHQLYLFNQRWVIVIGARAVDPLRHRPFLQQAVGRGLQ